MRIAFVHSFYRSNSPSGETLSVQEWMQTLKNAGHETRLVNQKTDELAQSRLYPLKAALWVASGKGADPTPELLEFKPDVVHVQNLFPNYSTDWLQHWDGPLVTTLHNYRPLCANGMLYRDGSPCSLCPDGKLWSSVQHRCYRGSRAATLPLTIRTVRNKGQDPLLARANRVVVLSERAKSIYIKHGVRESDLDVIPSHAWRNFPPVSNKHSQEWVYVGRIEDSKGLAELMRIWPSSKKLKVIGTGPDMELAKELAPASVEFLGFVSDQVLEETTQGAMGFVFPSRWAETQGMAACEAWGAGLPVVSLEGNAISDSIDMHGLGATYSDRDPQSLLRAINFVENSPQDLRTKVQDFYRDTYSRERWLRLVEHTYKRVLESHATG